MSMELGRDLQQLAMPNVDLFYSYYSILDNSNIVNSFELKRSCVCGYFLGKIQFHF